jgi:hypothetical protein
MGFGLLVVLGFGFVAPASAESAAPAARCMAADEPSLEQLLQPVQELAACTVSIQCTPGIQISCSSPTGNCTTSGGGDCVVCDGITQNCCSTCLACRSACLDEYFECRDQCRTRDCIADCADQRDACYDGCC